MRLKSSGKADITSEEEEIIRAAMLQEIPDLTDSLNENIANYQTTNMNMGQEEALGPFTQTGIKLLTIAVSVILCLLLIVTVLEEQSRIHMVCCSLWNNGAYIYVPRNDGRRRNT